MKVINIDVFNVSGKRIDKILSRVGGHYQKPNYVRSTDGVNTKLGI